MAFIEEVPTLEEIKKFDIHNLWKEHCRFHRAQFDDYTPYTFESIIDRERDFYFFPFEDEIFEVDTISNVYQYLLAYKGETIFIKLKENNKGFLTPGIYTDVWDIVSVTPNETKSLNYSQILTLIKEALNFKAENIPVGLNIKKYQYQYNF